MSHPWRLRRRTRDVRAYLAELVGTFFLVFTFLGVAASNNPLAPIAVSAVLVAMVSGGAHVSGAHFNPAVTAAALIRGRIPLADFFPYWAAQLSGALLASSIGMWVFEMPHKGLDLMREGQLFPALAVEFLFTSALAYVALTIGASRERGANGFYGLGVGLVVLAGMVTVVDISGAALNPAIAFGMAITGEFAWSSVWVYLVANLAGGLVAAVAAGLQERTVMRSLSHIDDRGRSDDRV